MFGMLGHSISMLNSHHQSPHVTTLATTPAVDDGPGCRDGAKVASVLPRARAMRKAEAPARAWALEHRTLGRCAPYWSTSSSVHLRSSKVTKETSNSTLPFIAITFAVGMSTLHGGQAPPTLERFASGRLFWAQEQQGFHTSAVWFSWLTHILDHTRSTCNILL